MLIAVVWDSVQFIFLMLAYYLASKVTDLDKSAQVLNTTDSDQADALSTSSASLSRNR